MYRSMRDTIDDDDSKNDLEVVKSFKGLKSLNKDTPDTVVVEDKNSDFDKSYLVSDDDY